MLPGVVLKSSDLNELGTFPKGRVTGINLVGNKLVCVMKLLSLCRIRILLPRNVISEQLLVLV